MFPSKEISLTDKKDIAAWVKQVARTSNSRGTGTSALGIVRLLREIRNSSQEAIQNPDQLYLGENFGQKLHELESHVG